MHELHYLIIGMHTCYLVNYKTIYTDILLVPLLAAKILLKPFYQCLLGIQPTGGLAHKDDPLLDSAGRPAPMI